MLSLLQQQTSFPVLEIFGEGAVIEFKATCKLMITGAAREVVIGNQHFDTFDIIEVSAGNKVHIRDIGFGWITYVFLIARLDLEASLGSFSTYLPARIGRAC